MISGFGEQELIEKRKANQAVWGTLQTSLHLCVSFVIVFALIFLAILILVQIASMLVLYLGVASHDSSFISKIFGSEIGKSSFFSIFFRWMKLGLTIGFIVGLFVSYNLGIKSCIQHFTLRGLLYRSGSAPWNYAQFLDYCTERMILQRVGGRYRFIHKSLQEHFASMSKYSKYR